MGLPAQSTAAYKIIAASEASHYDDAKRLMIEYREVALAEDYHIGGNSLNEELAAFPGPYVPPSGILLLAYSDGTPCGCLALRNISGKTGEVMRMYVQERMRGQGIAEALMRELLARAKQLGYETLYLDSLHKFKAAHKLYEKLGFTYCEPYDSHTTEDMKQNMVFMQKTL